MRVYKRNRVTKGQARSFHLYRRGSLAWLGESSGSFTSMVSVFEMLVRILMTQVGGQSDLQSKLCFRGKYSEGMSFGGERQWLAELGAEPNYVSAGHEYSIPS